MRAWESGSDVDLRLTTEHLESRQMWDCRSCFLNLHMSSNKPSEILQHHWQSLKVHSTACRHRDKEKHVCFCLKTSEICTPSTAWHCRHSWFPSHLSFHRSAACRAKGHRSPKLSVAHRDFSRFLNLLMLLCAAVLTILCWATLFQVGEPPKNSSHWSALN